MHWLHIERWGLLFSKISVVGLLPAVPPIALNIAIGLYVVAIAHYEMVLGIFAGNLYAIRLRIRLSPEADA